ncbi:MAG: FMN-binding protein [Planctomycetota bacterium]|jgi:Na+-transporting NADH:ubiquinone oxidoreductase subunit NqrC
MVPGAVYWKADCRILKSGQEADRNTVDGITGATMTSDRVQYILDKLTKELWEQQNTNEQ